MVNEEDRMAYGGTGSVVADHQLRTAMEGGYRLEAFGRLACMKLMETC